MEVNFANINTVLNSKIAFNGKTGKIFAQSKQALFYKAMQEGGYKYNVWSTANAWNDLGLSVKGAKGKGIKQRVFIPANGSAQEKTEYEIHLRKWLSIKTHNEKIAKGESKARKWFNPYVEVKGRGLIMSVWYFNVSDVRYKDEDGDHPVCEIVVPDALKKPACSQYELAFEPEISALLPNKKEDTSVKADDEGGYIEVEPEIIEAEVIEDKPDLNQEIAELKAEIETLKGAVDQLKRENDLYKMAIEAIEKVTTTIKSK